MRTNIINKVSSLSHDEFIFKCKLVHNDLYDYSSTIYIKSKCNISIICKRHGVFIQKASGHISGNGCPKCAYMDRSKMESDWLDTYNIPNNYRNYRIKINNRIIIVDGYDKDTNTIYEFWGDYWHGNPKVYDQNDINKRSKKTFGELYNNTLEKIKFIKDNGYLLIDIWEYEWSKK